MAKRALITGVTGQEVPQNENTPFHPYSPYAVAKLYGLTVVDFRRDSA